MVFKEAFSCKKVTKAEKIDGSNMNCERVESEANSFLHHQVTRYDVLDIKVVSALVEFKKKHYRIDLLVDIISQHFCILIKHRARIKVCFWDSVLGRSVNDVWRFSAIFDLPTMSDNLKGILTSVRLWNFKDGGS